MSAVGDGPAERAWNRQVGQGARYNGAPSGGGRRVFRRDDQPYAAAIGTILGACCLCFADAWRTVTGLAKTCFWARYDTWVMDNS